jgi:hypothetical protein
MIHLRHASKQFAVSLFRVCMLVIARTYQGLIVKVWKPPIHSNLPFLLGKDTVKGSLIEEAHA